MLVLRWDTSKVRDMFGGMGRFNCWLRGKERVNSVIPDAIIWSFFLNIRTMKQHVCTQ